jgi:hypothetical protein
MHLTKVRRAAVFAAPASANTRVGTPYREYEARPWLEHGSRHEHRPEEEPAAMRHMGFGHRWHGTLPYEGWRYESTYRQLTSGSSRAQSWWDVQDEMPTGNTLHVHSFVRVSQPKPA